MAPLTLRLFGGVHARFGEQGLTFPTRKAEALLAYLAVRPEEAYLRSKLAGIFWGDAGKEQARQSLRQSLSFLRRALSCAPSQILVVQGELVSLDRSSLDIDVVEFERLASRNHSKSLGQGAAPYAGDLLDGVDISEEPFEDWLRHERARLREIAVNVLTRLVSYQARCGVFVSATHTR